MTLALCPPLKVLFLNCTEKCNLRCKHCIKASSGDCNVSLPREVAFRILADFQSLGGCTLIVTGGEPFLYQHLNELLTRACELNLQTVVLTNGTLLDAHAAKFIASLNIRMHVSFEGPTQEMNDVIRGTGSFVAAAHGAQLLSEATVEWALQTTASVLNMNEMPSMLQLARQLGARKLIIAKMEPYGRAAAAETGLMLTHAHQRCLAADVKKLVDQKILAVDCEYLEWLDLFEERTKAQTNKHLMTCGAGFNKCAVSARGEILPCNKFFGLPCGNVTRNQLSEIWRQSPVLLQLRRFAETPTANSNVICGKCRFAGACAGGCRATAHNVTGDLLAPDPMCWQLGNGS